MTAPKQLNIGLIGAGIVGGGVATNLTRNADLLAGRLTEPVRRVLARPVPATPDLDGARRGATRILELLDGSVARTPASG